MNKLNYLFAILIFVTLNSTTGQVSVPYYNNFDNPKDTTGWFHYALNGTDDWEIGIPDGIYFDDAYSAPNAWVTNLEGNFEPSSNRVLETPSYDLSNQSVDYILSFFQKRRDNNTQAYYYLEYSTDNGNSWQLLDNDNTVKKNWQGTSGFPGFPISSFEYSLINLSFIQGQDNVKFRYRFNTGQATGDGWMIDDFSIAEEYFNIHASQSDSIFIGQNCEDVTLTSSLDFINFYSDGIYNTTNYYFSTDTILDLQDELIGTKSANISGSISFWTQNLALPQVLPIGYNYILYEHDALNVLQENDELDNIGFAVVKVDPIYNIPFIDDFENSADPWKAYLENANGVLVWELGEGYRHHIEDAHSGTKAWHTSKSIEYEPENCSSECNTQYLESPYVDMTTGTGDLIFNLWFKDQIMANSYSIEFKVNCGLYWYNLFYFPLCRDDDWDFINHPMNSFSSYDNIKFRIKYETSYLDPEGISVDDIYIGTIKPDLTIERDKKNRFTATSAVTDSIKYYLNNGGVATAAATQTTFYLSLDTIFDDTDIFLGIKQEPILSDTARIWTNFTYTKPTTAEGKYYIFYFLDNTNVVDEMREYNNSGYFTLYQENAATVPYFNDFETQIDGWRHNATLGNDDWQWTIPNGEILDSAFSGTKAWITGDSAKLSPMSRMHLYTPVFEYPTFLNPVLEFDMKLDGPDQSENVNGQVNLSYSIDGGATWVVLDILNQSYNRWYYQMDYFDWNGTDHVDNLNNYSELLFDAYEYTFAQYDQYNSRDADRNTRYIIDISELPDYDFIQFRFNLATSVPNPNQSPNQQNLLVEGALIDNFTIRNAFIDLNVNYKKSLMISSYSEEIKFFMNVKNQGNYISDSCIVKYYVSNDSLLDTSDYFLGDETVSEIRPDMYYYINAIFNAPSNLSDYQYLIYELDATNTNTEYIESNNIGYWNLALDSISVYPYLQNFNDTIVNGWNHFVMDYFDNIHLKNQYRFRNMVAPGEPLYSTYIKSGEMFTDRINQFQSQSDVPYWFLDTPSFNFSGLDSLFLSFDLMCIGNSGIYRDGGNLHFSTDGGNTWTVLTSLFGEAYNWYPYYEIEGLNDEPGWSEDGPDSYQSLDSTSIDISFLKGEEHVVFRFKFRSDGKAFITDAQGMRIDNFRIDGLTVDYVANDTLVPINTTILQPDFNVDYSITNIGQSNGRITTTKFYWSTDSIFDGSDSLVKVITENSISTGTTLSSSVEITYPTPISQNIYYLFYKTDANSILLETDEQNNIGSFIINFPSYPNYYSNIEWDTIYAFITQPDFDLTYSIINNGLLDGLNSNTVFYWSEDNIFDLNDQNIQTSNDNPIQTGDTLISTISINYPLPINQLTYYLFYKADNSDEILETNETDNTGVFVIYFDDLISVEQPTFRNVELYVHGKNIFINYPQVYSSDNSFKLNVYDAIGQAIYFSDINLNPGQNIFPLPNNLPSGIYLISLNNSKDYLTRKAIIQN